MFVSVLLAAAYWNLTLPAVLCSEELTQFEVYYISLAVALHLGLISSMTAQFDKPAYYINLAVALHSEIQVTNTDLAYFRYTLDIAFLAVVLLLH